MIKVMSKAVLEQEDHPWLARKILMSDLPAILESDKMTANLGIFFEDHSQDELDTQGNVSAVKF